MKLYGKSFENHFDYVKKNGTLLYKSGNNFNIFLFEDKCYSIAIDTQCQNSFFGDVEHVYNLIYNEIKLNYSKNNVLNALKRFIKLRIYFNNFEHKKKQLKYLLKTIKR